METEKLCSLTVSAPGKVILHGEHSVVYGKTAIAASLGLRSRIQLNERKCSPHKQTAKIDFPLVGLQCEVDLNSLQDHLFKIPSLNGSRLTIDSPDLIDHVTFIRQIDKYLSVHMKRFESLRDNQKNALTAFVYICSVFLSTTDTGIKPFDLLVDSELSVGAGTGSSASYSVCLAGIFLQLVLIKTGKVEEVSESHPKMFPPEHAALISSWAFNCERIMHGNPSGVDNAVCAFGSYVQFKKGEQPVLLRIPLHLRILLVNTNEPRETIKLVAKVASLRERNQTAVFHILDACDSISQKAVEIMTAISKCDSSADGNFESSYMHLEELWGMNHCLLSALGVSHPKLEEIRSIASRYNLACKLTGAGGGGYALILVPPHVDKLRIERLQKDLVTRGFNVIETELACDGVRVDK